MREVRDRCNDGQSVCVFERTRIQQKEEKESGTCLSPCSVLELKGSCESD